MSAVVECASGDWPATLIVIASFVLLGFILWLSR